MVMAMDTYSQDTLQHIAFSFREAIIQVIKDNAFSGTLLRSFPKGNCSYVSELLQKYYLFECGIETYQVAGHRKNDMTHEWLETADGTVIDITGDQFPERQGIIVYVGLRDSFYNSFIEHARQRVDEEDLYDPFPSCFELEKKKNYDSIVSRMIL